MLYVPTISDYKPFYIQFDGGAAKDILNEYKVVVRAHEYPLTLKVKEPYKNEWKDEHGDEEYIGQSGLYLQAFTYKLKCAMFANGLTLDYAISDLKSGVRAFQNALLGGFFKTYDSWTGFGFQNVRVSEFPLPENSDYRVWGESARVLFTVTLKVNDPKTLMRLSSGSIVAE